MNTLKVKVQRKKSTKGGKEYESLYIGVPKPYADLLRIKAGEYLSVTIRDIDVNGKRVRALVYWKE